MARSYGSNEHRIHDSFGMIGPLRSNTTIPREFIHKQYIRIEGDTQCPADDRDSMTVCPSYFAMEYDPFRIPDTMLQAQCQCSECRGNDTNGHVRECKKLFYYTRVFRVVECDESNVYRYEEVWESISVGCHCQLSNSMMQGGTHTAPQGPRTRH